MQSAKVGYKGGIKCLLKNISIARLFISDVAIPLIDPEPVKFVLHR
jgi:hypothetical protein